MTQENAMTQREHGYVLTEQEGDPIWFLGNLSTMKAKSDQTQNAYGMYVALIAPESGPPPHLHYHQDEAFFVLDGEAHVRCGEQPWHASKGAFVFLPQGIPHTYKAGNTPLKMVVITSPGGPLGFEYFVEAMGEPAQTRTLPAPKAPDRAKLQRLAAQYDIEFVAMPL